MIKCTVKLITGDVKKSIKASNPLKLSINPHKAPLTTAFYFCLALANMNKIKNSSSTSGIPFMSHIMW
jgi:hypothetical protein